jgi:hypothetical protein
MTPLEEALARAARESGRFLGELGVRPSDEKWIGEHARTVASLAGGIDPVRAGRSWLYRLARRAARMVR